MQRIQVINTMTSDAVYNSIFTPVMLDSFDTCPGVHRAIFHIGAVVLSLLSPARPPTSPSWVSVPETVPVWYKAVVQSHSSQWIKSRAHNPTSRTNHNRLAPYCVALYRWGKKVYARIKNLFLLTLHNYHRWIEDENDTGAVRNWPVVEEEKARENTQKMAEIMDCAATSSRGITFSSYQQSMSDLTKCPIQ